jgi:type II secretory ATPase GspE/PulE/Tfp pilus assembly ATPase PilB-like protein
VGRLGLFELLPIDEEWSGKIAAGAGEASLLGTMRERGMPTLIEDAAEKVVSGLVCMADVRRALTVW